MKSVDSGKRVITIGSILFCFFRKQCHGLKWLLYRAMPPEAFKDAGNKYKNALSKAESAIS